MSTPVTVQHNTGQGTTQNQYEATAHHAINANNVALSLGTSPGDLVQLDSSSGKLPAVDGSLLTNLPNDNYVLQLNGSTDGTVINSALSIYNSVYCCGAAGGINTTVIVGSGKKLEFNPGCALTPTDNINTFEMRGSGILVGNNTLIDYYTPVKTGIPFLLQTSTGGTMDVHSGTAPMVRGFRCSCGVGSGSGTGIAVLGNSGTGHWIWGAKFDDITFVGLEYGVNILANSAGDWCNGCWFNRIQFTNVMKAITISTAGGSGAYSNRFRDCEWEAGANTSYIYLGAGAHTTVDLEVFDRSTETYTENGNANRHTLMGLTAYVDNGSNNHWYVQ